MVSVAWLAVASMLSISSAVTLRSIHADKEDANGRCAGVHSPHTRAEGEVLERIPSISIDECCTKCERLEKCKLFVYGGAWKGLDAACTLLATQERIFDAGSGGNPDFETVVLERAVQAPEPANDEIAHPWGACGGSLHTTKCCPEGFYCQPWSTSFYQCMSEPARFSKMETNVELVGHELKCLSGVTPESCFHACEDTHRCRGFTYVNETPRGSQCYLMRHIHARKPRNGAVSSVFERKLQLRRNEH